jgi:hypothetical protein
MSILPSYACTTRGCPEEALPVAFLEECKAAPECRCCGKPMERREDDESQAPPGIMPVYASREG